MNFGQKIALSLLLTIVLGSVAFAEVIEIPDPNLRAAIREALALPADVRVTQDAMQDLTAIVASSRQIQELTGVEYAVNLRKLRLAGNRITDLRPIAGLTKLKLLDLFSNPISDLTPLANLAALELLGLGACHIDDIAPLTSLVTLSSLDLRFNVIDNIRPLAGLSRLTELLLTNNLITDVSPLSKLTSLERLELHGNRIADHTPLDGLSLDHFIYDQQCDFPPLPLQPRLENRTFPSVFTAWGSIGHSTVLNQPHLSDLEQLAQHDLHVGGPSLFHVHLVPTAKGWAVQGELDRGVQTRDDFIAINPNMVFLLQLALRTRTKGEFPDDSHYWIKDANGQPVSQKGGTYLWDFTNPDVQDIIVEEAIAVAKCGLYDGIFFDWWNDDHAILADFDGDWSHKFRGNEVEQAARVNIVRRIRAATRPDFLIMGNTNERILPRTGAYVNGGFMETGMPFDRTGDELEETVDRVEKALLWLENNLREPRINGLQAHIQPSETPDSPSSLRWMRAATALSLTHSDGYILFRAEQYHGHYWYNFWDANLGRPVGPKAQLYDEDVPGLYIREYTNGWAVYNHSGAPQVITLPEEVQGVASGLAGTEHALANLDGEMYLRVTPPNPADVNGDGVVNIFDLTLVAQAFGKDGLEADVNGDGVVNVFDLVFVANQF